MQEVYQPNAVIPSPIGPLTIGSFLGTGAFGSVYSATDEWSNELAIKVLRTHPNTHQVFSRESANLIALRHPNIVHIHSDFIYNNMCHIVMERCSGTLGNLFERKLISPIYLLPVARCILQGINFMHSLNYVHKDLHEGNIFWTVHRNEFSHIASNNAQGDSPSYTFKIGDLGVSKLFAELSIFNATLAPWMLPPEHLRPDLFGFIGPQVDIYHAGLLFLSILNGAVVRFSNQEIINGGPRDIAQAFSSPYGPVIARALRRRVAMRTQTAIQFWRELKAVSQ